MVALTASISVVGHFCQTLKASWGLYTCPMNCVKAMWPCSFVLGVVHVLPSFVLQVWEILVSEQLQVMGKLRLPFCPCFLAGLEFCDISFMASGSNLSFRAIRLLCMQLRQV